MKNWQTSLAGLIGISSVVFGFFYHDYHMDIADIGVLTASIGLLCAKDKNVTGGTIDQNVYSKEYPNEFHTGE